MSSLVRRASVLTALGLVTALASAQGAVDVYVNGEPVVFSGTGPQTINNRVLVPLRGVLEKLGAFVGWDSNAQLVTATKEDIDIQLRIGERVARVNGNPVALDVPAQLYQGRTLVPLRFVSEALGAQVRWDPVQYAVLIDTNVTDSPSQPRPTTPGAIQIESFNVGPTGWIKPGGSLQFTLRGTAGGEAYAVVPGIMRELELEEVRPGEYIGSWVVPEPRGTDDRINIADVSPIARLMVGSNERLIQAGTNISVDNTAPDIRSMTPELNARVTTDRPNITAVFDDAAGSGIDVSSVQVLLNDRPITSEATITKNLVAYTPPTGLPRGEHEVTIRANDMAGNITSRTWTFFVDDVSADIIRRFTVDAPDTRPGDVVTFVLLAEEGGEATFSIGDMIEDQPLREVSPGRYEGTYTIRRGDIFDRDDVVATFVARNGRVYNVQPTGTVQVDAGTLLTPTITSPGADAEVDSPLVVSGRSTPNARVQVRITYRTEVAGALQLTGTVAQVEVQADDRGRWSTEALDLSTLVRGQNTTYTITAVTVGSEGRLSEPATVQVTRA